MNKQVLNQIYHDENSMSPGPDNQYKNQDLRGEMDCDLDLNNKFRDSARYINVQNNGKYFNSRPIVPYDDKDHDLEFTA